MLFVCVANAAYDTKKIELHYSFLRVQLLSGAIEEIGVSECGGDSRAESQRLLQRIEEVLEGVRRGFRVGEALYDGIAEIAREKMLLHSRCLFLEPGLRLAKQLK